METSHSESTPFFNGPVRRFPPPPWGEERIVATGQVEHRFIRGCLRGSRRALSHHCGAAFGNAPAAALSEVEQAIEAWLAAAREDALPIPEPHYRAPTRAVG